MGNNIFKMYEALIKYFPMGAYKCGKNINQMHSKFIIVVPSREREGTGKVNKEDFNLCISYFILCKKTDMKQTCLYSQFLEKLVEII